MIVLVVKVTRRLYCTSRISSIQTAARAVNVVALLAKRQPPRLRTQVRFLSTCKTKHQGTTSTLERYVEVLMVTLGNFKTLFPVLPRQRKGKLKRLGDKLVLTKATWWSWQRGLLHQFVELDFAGSNPVGHPKYLAYKAIILVMISL